MTTNTMNMISLGGYRFSANLNPFHNRNKTKSYNFASRDRWQGVEALQFKGRKAEVQTFDIKVVVNKKEDLNILPDLKVLGDEGKGLKLISPSEGGYLGLWVVTNFTEKTSDHTTSGIGLVQEGQLSIKEFVE